MGLVFLPRHEARVVMNDGEYDPTWRPFPNSDLGRADYEDDYEAAYNSALADRLRRHHPFIELNASSKHWRKSARLRVFLVAKRLDGETALIGVGNCATQTRRGWLGTAVIRLSAWRLFGQAVSLRDLLSNVPDRMGHVVARLFDEEESRGMPDAAGRAVWAAMRILVPDLDEALSELPAFPIEIRLTTEELTRTDAAISALRFFSSSWRVLRPLDDPPPPTAFATHLESIAVRDEDEIITDDTAGFLDWSPDLRSQGGWYVFRSPDDERILRVKNINFKDAETATGADLVYIRENPECVVLVQYKLLTSNKGSAAYFFRDKNGRLRKQVTKMLSFSTVPTSDPSGVDVYRIAGDIGFVKFVEPTRPVRKTGELVIPDGRYHPAEGVLRMLNHPSLGPKKGPIHLVDEWRSLDGETFAKLVRDQWVGSVGPVTEELLAILELSRQPLVLALEESSAPAQESTQTTSVNS
jgi:hypothetical protein